MGSVSREGDPSAGAPKPWRLQLWVSVAGGSRGLPRGRWRGRKRGVSVGISVAVLACWRPISQMIFATIKKCVGVKWRFHIQQGKGGWFTWARAAPLSREGTSPPLGPESVPSSPSPQSLFPCFFRSSSAVPLTHFSAPPCPRSLCHGFLCLPPVPSPFPSAFLTSPGLSPPRLCPVCPPRPPSPWFPEVCMVLLGSLSLSPRAGGPLVRWGSTTTFGKTPSSVWHPP